MKKALKFFLVFVTIFSVLIGGTVLSYASSMTRVINDIYFNAYSSISASNASVGTVSGSGNISVTASGVYSYINYNTLKVTTVTKSESDDPAIVVSFTAPSECRSVRVLGGHTAKSGTETWTGATSAYY